MPAVLAITRQPGEAESAGHHPIRVIHAIRVMSPPHPERFDGGDEEADGRDDGIL
jgi:hypothetical protein